MMLTGPHMLMGLQAVPHARGRAAGPTCAARVDLLTGRLRPDVLSAWIDFRPANRTFLANEPNMTNPDICPYGLHAKPGAREDLLRDSHFAISDVRTLISRMFQDVTGRFEKPVKIRYFSHFLKQNKHHPDKSNTIVQ